MALDVAKLLTDMTNRMSGMVGVMSGQLARMMPPETRYPLTPHQQLVRFLNHTPESLQYIRQRYGDAEFLRYVQAMRQLYDRMVGQGGG